MYILEYVLDVCVCGMHSVALFLFFDQTATKSIENGKAVAFVLNDPNI